MFLELSLLFLVPMGYIKDLSNYLLDISHGDFPPYFKNFFKLKKYVVV